MDFALIQLHWLSPHQMDGWSQGLAHCPIKHWVRCIDKTMPLGWHQCSSMVAPATLNGFVDPLQWMLAAHSSGSCSTSWWMRGSLEMVISAAALAPLSASKFFGNIQGNFDGSIYLYLVQRCTLDLYSCHFHDNDTKISQNLLYCYVIIFRILKTVIVSKLTIVFGLVFFSSDT